MDIQAPPVSERIVSNASYGKVNPLTATAEELQDFLTSGSLSSLDLINIYLGQIEQHNKNGLKLNAIISTAPQHLVTEQARLLDAERARGSIRGPLHGIPVVVKDNVMTDSSLGMDTTCGSYALVGAKAPNAPIVDRLLKAGMIIIGKANLSEWAGSKGFGMVTGWSAVGGQTQSPYVRGDYVPGDKVLGHSTPCGSSSGSAVAVAAGFVPVALGTESDGSITQPAGRVSLYAMKVTVGALDTKGTSPQSPITDSLGGMAKSSGDLANFIGAMMEQDYSSYLTKTWAGQKVAFVDPSKWELHPAVCERIEIVREKQISEFLQAVATIRKSGAEVTENVVLPQVDEIAWEGEDALETVWNSYLGSEINSFLNEYTESSVRTVEQLIQWNSDHKDLELPPGKRHHLSETSRLKKPEADNAAAFPGQQQLENTLKSNLTEEKRQEIVSFIRKIAKDDGFDRIFEETGAEVLIGPLDGRIVTVAAAAGYPAGVAPLGYADNYNGRAYGVAIVAKAGDEGKILQAMSAWEETMPRRIPPPQLVNYEASL
ncbi:Amidase domain-containing protein [Trichoderma simmonsii]|uniref:Amidase domain-containing protein n=1 Tax=Trichoderma simmonsii TaxID=1491479 RepID=A0A8G0PK85_9HYPO|nr:Amidase domain-containing protein [Trichoderma simmonsii]